MTEPPHHGNRPLASFAAAARALLDLGRLRDVPVVVMLAWVGWLAIPWPTVGPAQAGSAAGQPLHAGDAVPPPFDEPSLGRAQSFHGQSFHGRPLRAEPLHLGDGASPRGGASLRDGASPQDGASSRDGASPRDVGEVIAAERERIAAEVHDAAGHSLAAIAMQAKLALLVWDEDPRQARESLEAIRTTSTQTLDRLRLALDAIDPGGGHSSRDGHDGHGRADSGDAGTDLGRLIDGVRTAGLPVDVAPAEPYIPARLQGVVYRVVRESLTNVMRHAGPTSAAVRFTYDPAGFAVEVADRGRGPSTAGEGRGLAGMRTQVAKAGGAFAYGSRDGGGFRVVARFPGETA
ncbi:Histidine kinase [Sinosporangium album]|uniref:histidine kinase n=1 Tax=Sinosporangium album TaxID=504805 RepID=A0A1G7UXT1_9ACTN|nr:sensor histidine kinase [Sinosporangium album]SDG52415.1 Histidine kinase [Sinosporangium album]